VFQEQIGLLVRIPNAPSSVIPADTGLVVVGSVELLGFLTLADKGLMLEYQVEVPGVEMIVPNQRLVIPFDAVSALRVTGGWWRPLLEVAVHKPSAVAPLALERDGCVRFRIARSLRRQARELVATAALRAAELLDIPPQRLLGG
jgi:hypothetical protein